MEAILSPEKRGSPDQQLMAGSVVSRSRKARDPSALVKWSVAPPPPPHLRSANILVPPRVTTTITTTNNINNNNTNSNVNSNWGLLRSASLPTRFTAVEQDSTVRPPVNRALPLLAPPPPQVHKKKSYHHEQLGASPNNYGPVFEEDQTRARAAKRFTKGDKVMNEQSRKPEKKQVTSCSSPINTGNRSRLVRHSSASVACNTLEDEKYAGPAYSKSPPPCSLPFPRFSVHQPAGILSGNNNTTDGDKSSTTATLPGGNSSGSSLESPSTCNCWDTSFATRDLKRILNLDQQVAT